MWRVAKSLDVMLRQVNERWPVRDKSSDGTIGDAAHAARESDHNPNAEGVVCARDITHDPAHGFDSYAFADMLLRNKDERIKYVISNRRIASGTGQSNPAWVWRPYSGANAHDHHVHISVKGDPAHYDNTALWAGVGLTVPAPTDPIPPRPPTPTPQPALPAMSVLQSGDRGPDVRRLQEILFVDGIFGSTTEKAVKIFQWDHGLDADGIVGPETWRELLKWAGQPPPPLVPTLPLPAGKGQTSITATVFGGSKDRNESAYTGKVLNDSDLYIALPWRLAGERPLVRLINPANGRTCIAAIQDIGPWNTDDNYPAKNARPVAETCYANKTPLPSGPNKGKVPANDAGIDLSPAVSRALGIEGKGKVDWDYVDNAPLAPTPAKPIATDAPKPTPASWADFDIWGWLKSLFKSK